MQLIDRIFAARGLKNKELRAAFLSPNYLDCHDSFLLPDMEKAVKRLVTALKTQQKIVIYGDYDIDGLTATALLLDALRSFGYKNVRSVIPSRFTDGYGLTVDAIEEAAKQGSNLMITVDCGSLGEKEIIRANKLGLDVIVTDHHNPADIQPPAIAVINPKRIDSRYPFRDLSGVGVAFKLVQALQMKLNEANPSTRSTSSGSSTSSQTVSLSNSSGLPFGQEKWLLDLVALGTVCDVVPLVDENRIFAYWGIKVLSKQKRLGLKALMAVSDINPSKLNSRSLGYVLGPRMNAAGRLETAQFALDLLITDDSSKALDEAEHLDEMNKKRRKEQSEIIKQAITMAEKYQSDKVLVLSDASWNKGIVGIVASKMLEKFAKPIFILQENGDESRGSARSFGDFSVADAVRSCDDIIISGGGHNMAAGVTLLTKNIILFRKRVNEYYDSLNLKNQSEIFLPRADTRAELSELSEEVVDAINQLEPFGNGNPQPILQTDNLLVREVRTMGTDGQHIKLDLVDELGIMMQFLAFNAPDHIFVKIGEKVNVWYHLDINEWQGRRSVEGRLLHLELADKLNKNSLL